MKRLGLKGGVDFLRLIAARLKPRPFNAQSCESACALAHLGWADRLLAHGQSQLLQAEAFAHQALQAGFVEQVVGKFFVGEHGEGGALGSGSQF